MWAKYAFAFSNESYHNDLVDGIRTQACPQIINHEVYNFKLLGFRKLTKPTNLISLNKNLHKI